MYKIIHKYNVYALESVCPQIDLIIRYAKEF